MDSDKASTGSGAGHPTASSIEIISLGDLAGRLTSLQNEDSVDFEVQHQVLNQVLEAVWQPGWLETLSQTTVLEVVRTISSQKRQLLLKAAAWSRTLLHLYKAIQHGRRDGGKNAAGSPDCCTACHVVLAALLDISIQEPSFIQAEAFNPREDAATPEPTRQLGAGAPPPTSSSSRLVLSPTPLLKEMVQTAQAALKHCQPCTVPDLAWDGSTKGYSQGLAPADPCPSSHAPNAAPASSLLEKWVRVLGAIASSGKVAARELHRCQVLDFLQEVLEVCRAPAPSLVEAVEAAYGALARQSQAASQEMLDTSLVPALTGMALHSEKPSLVLAALDRLLPLVDSCTGAEYQHILRPTGMMAAVHRLMLLSLDAHDAGSCDGRAELGSIASPTAGPSPRPVRPWDAALAAVAASPAGAAAGFHSSGASSGPGFSPPQARALEDTAQSLLLACLDRSRRQAGLKPMQAPRAGYWSVVRPRELLLLERRLIDGRRSVLPTADQGSTAGAAALPQQQILQHRQLSLDQVSAAANHPSMASRHSSRGTGSDDPYDEDGLRVVWDSAPPEHVRAARADWRNMLLRDRISWSQTSDEVNVWIKLPKGTAKHEVDVTIDPQHLCVKLGWHGRFLDGPLTRRVKSKESVWCLTGADDAAVCDVLHVMMPKDAVRYWRSLFEGSEEKSHMELLKEAVDADERVVGWDEMDEGAREIFEDLQERQALVASGCFDLQNSFDDFRVVIGDSTL